MEKYKINTCNNYFNRYIEQLLEASYLSSAIVGGYETLLADYET